jgi:radical SAM-linked protein
MNPADAVQRLRVTFGVDGPLIYASVLDMGRLWERLLRRAAVPLAYSQGFSPHPRMQFAAALPVGYSSECELLDLWLRQYIAPLDFARAVQRQLPPGLSISEVGETPLKAPAPQSGMREAFYQVRLWVDISPEAIARWLQDLLARPQIIRQRLKKGQMEEYDLRPLIHDARYVHGFQGEHELELRLACGPQGAGRPEEILATLDARVKRYIIHRKSLVWSEGEERKT